MITIDNVLDRDVYKDILLFLFIAEGDEPVRRAHLIYRFVTPSSYSCKNKGVKYIGSEITLDCFGSFQKWDLITFSKKFASIGVLRDALQTLKKLNLITSYLAKSDGRTCQCLKLTRAGGNLIIKRNLLKKIDMILDDDQLKEFYYKIDEIFLDILNSEPHKKIVTEMVTQKKKGIGVIRQTLLEQMAFAMLSFTKNQYAQGNKERNEKILRVTEDFVYINDK